MECPQCKGKGYVWGMLMGKGPEPEAERDFCPTCNGTGKVKEKVVWPDLERKDTSTSS